MDSLLASLEHAAASFWTVAKPPLLGVPKVVEGIFTNQPMPARNVTGTVTVMIVILMIIFRKQIGKLF
jgi:hypothetical protein